MYQYPSSLYPDLDKTEGGLMWVSGNDSAFVLQASSGIPLETA